MRQVIDPQLKLSVEDIAAINLDSSSRDDIPQILRGLQHIFTNPEIRAAVFIILQEILPESMAQNAPPGQKADPDNGRPGMSQWTIFVLGMLRLGLNADYDRIQNLANEHRTIRQMLGHDSADDTYYALQTLKDNLRLFTPEILDRVNQVVVHAGHQVADVDPQAPAAVRCDSFVVKTNVHYPTDINLLWDAINKVIALSAELAKANGISGFRQQGYHQRQIKKQYRNAQQLRRSRTKNEEKKEAREQEIAQAYRKYLDMAQTQVDRAEALLGQVDRNDAAHIDLIDELQLFIGHARRQIDQIERRILQGEKIPHEEKTFSLFEPHTEWINKGKAGVPVELGLKVVIVEDEHQFILHHQVMQGTTDEKVAQDIVNETQQRFPNVRIASFDKGFHSKPNQTALNNRLDRLVMPKKGKCNADEYAREHDQEFIRFRHQHSAVESAINALEAHGLDRCPDHGIAGFKRYVALAIVARNIQRLGAILLQQENERAERRRRKPELKIAA